MNILIACEESQAVCKAFREKGHRAFSCDLQKCSGGHPEWHINYGVLPILGGGTEFQTQDGKWHSIDGAWDLVIAHPPCTYLTVSGNAWFVEDKWHSKALNRYLDRVDGIRFFMQFVTCNAKKVCIENPIGIMSNVYRKPDQIVQPYEYGHNSRKATCFWLKGLPKLEPTEIVEPDLVTYVNEDTGRVRTFSRDFCQGYKADERSKTRSKTFEGIAKAMAEQWG